MTESASSSTSSVADADKDAILIRSQQDRQQMFRLIESEEAIAFVGAGLSHPLYPTWGKFLENLANRAVELTNKPVALAEGLSEGDVLDYAEAIKRHFIDNASIEQ